MASSIGNFRPRAVGYNLLGLHENPYMSISILRRICKAIVYGDHIIHSIWLGGQKTMQISLQQEKRCQRIYGMSLGADEFQSAFAQRLFSN